MKYKKEIREWLVIISVFGLLYITGLHTEVFGFIQRGILATGLIKANTDQPVGVANYNWQLTDFEGNTTDFFKFKNQTVLINFWATWCPPCIAEMPDLQKLYEEEGKSTVFVMISLDENQQKAREFIAKKGYTFPVYFVDHGIPSVFQNTAIPTTFVIAPDGTIASKTTGMAKYNTRQFKEFLASLHSK